MSRWRRDPGVAVAPVVVVDHLDFWSRIALMRQGGHRDIRYFSRMDGPLSKLLDFALRVRGDEFSLLRPTLSDRPYRGYFVEFMERMLEFGLAHVEPLIESALGSLEFGSDLERRRTIRYLLLGNSRVIMRQTEVFEAARSISSGDRAVAVMVESNAFGAASAEFAKTFGLQFASYAAPLRFTMARRPRFRAHEGDRWSGEAAAHHVLRWCKAATLSASALIRRAADFGNEDGYDVIALNAKPAPSRRIDDLFWLDAFKDRCQGRVAVLCTTPVTGDVMALYGARVDALNHVSAVMHRVGLLGVRAHAARRRYALDTISAGWRVARAVFAQKLPLAFGAALLALWERVAFYQAVMNETGARVGWAMNEGHDLETQAFAVAMSRRGGVLAGSTWSMWDTPHLDCSFNRNDVMLVSGARQIGLFENSGAIVKRFVMTGYPTTRVALNDRAASEIVDSWKAGEPEAVVLCFFDNAAADDFPLSETALLEVYDTVIGAVEAKTTLRLLIKTKRRDLVALPDSMRERLDKLISEGRVLVRELYGDLASGLAVDAVLGICASSLGLLAAHRGQKGILYDPERILVHYPVSGLDELCVVSTCEALHDEIAALTPRRESETKRRSTTDNVDHFADDGGDCRTAHYLVALVTAARDGMQPDAMIRRADQEPSTWTAREELERIA